jgi:hypothetical protein
MLLYGKQRCQVCGVVVEGYADMDDNLNRLRVPRVMKGAVNWLIGKVASDGFDWYVTCPNPRCRTNGARTTFCMRAYGVKE